MPDHLQQLFETDQEAYRFYQSLPMFIQDAAQQHAHLIHTREELSAFANRSMSDGLRLEQYQPLFDDADDSDIDR